MRNLNYSFSNSGESSGIDLRQTAWSDGNEITDKKELWVPIVKLAPPDQRLQNLQEDRITSGNIEYALVNPDGDGPLQVYFMGLAGNLDDPVAQAERSALSAIAPDSPIVVPNFPGSGKSALVPTSVMRDMRRKQSLIPYGNLLVDEIGSDIQNLIFDRNRKVDVKGISLGADIAIGFTAAYYAAKQGEVDSLIAVDAIGSGRHYVPDVAYLPGIAGMLDVDLNFLREAGPASQYAAQSPFNELSDLGEKQILDGATNTSWIKTATKSLKTSWQNFVRWPIVAGRVNLAEDVRKAFPAVAGNLTIISPEFSGLGDPEKTQRILAALAAGSDGPDLLQHLIVKNHSTSVVSAGAGAAVIATMFDMAA